MFDKAFINGNVWIDEEFKKVNVYVNQDKIVEISNNLLDASEIIDVNSSLVLPGLIDPHVHFNLDLGYIHSRDGFLSGSRQAAYGGISAYIDFLEPVDNPEDLEKAFYKRSKEVNSSYVDYFFHATIKNPQCDLEVFVKKMLSLNIHSLKLFTTYSDSNRRTYDYQIVELLKLSEKYKFLLLAHIEDDELINLDPTYRFNDLLKSRPSLSEEKEALKLAGFVKEYGGYLYMVHLSSGTTLEKLKAAFPELINKKFFIESCPHYFTFTNEAVNTNEGYLYTLAPPLRTKEEQIKLKKSFKDIYAIGTDHCAFNKDDKSDRLLKDMPLGIGGIEYSFDMMYHFFKEEVISKMSKNIVTLYPKLKGYGDIQINNYANLFVYQLKDTLIKDCHGDTDYSVYTNLQKSGELIHSLLRGKFIIKDKLIQKAFGKEL